MKMSVLKRGHPFWDSLFPVSHVAFSFKKKVYTYFLFLLFILVQRFEHLSRQADSVQQSDIFLSVKTTQGFHRTRLELIIKTWFQLARDETWFFTDAEDPEIDRKTSEFKKKKLNSNFRLSIIYSFFLDGHLRVTSCQSDHSRQALCCKMAAEIDAFFDSQKK